MVRTKGPQKFWNFEGSRDGVVRDSLPCRRHCPLPRSGLRRRRGLEIVDEFVDTGGSGAKSSRPARDLLLEADGLRQVGLVLCWRLGRRGKVSQRHRRHAAAAGGVWVYFLAVSQGLGTEDSNPMPRCMMTLMAALAEMERR